MRISDWSSDVCSSDLLQATKQPSCGETAVSCGPAHAAPEYAMENTPPRKVAHQQTDRGYVPVYATGVVEQPWSSYSPHDHEVWERSEERRDGKERVSTCRSRWSQDR